MERFDEQIMSAKKEFNPSKDFTKKTMKKININLGKQIKFNWFRAFAFSGAAMFAILAVGFVVLHNTNGADDKSSETVAVSSNTNNGQQNTTQQESQPSSSANQTNNQSAVASNIDADLAQLDREVAGYEPSYSDTSLDNLSQ